MTLRTRLLALTVSMVAIVALTLIALNVNSLVMASFDSAIGSSEMAGRQIQSVIMRRLSSALPAGTGFLDTKRTWNQMVMADKDLAALLEQTMAQSRSIVEIDVANEEGVILASSNPRKPGVPLTAREDLRALRSATPVRRMMAVLTGSDDYETRVPLGIEGQRRPILEIQTLVSPVLLRAATLPGLRSLGLASGVALTLAFLLAWWSVSLALRPLARIGHLIDDIVSGGGVNAQAARTQEKIDAALELATVEDKLSLLSERFHDARQDANHLRTNLEEVLGKLDAGTRKQLEDQIALARRLTAINSLTEGVAHEIKNPLNSIALRLEVLRSQIAGHLPEAEPELAVLSAEVTRLDRVVRTFLDFNRPLELSFEDIDIGGMVAGISEFLEPEAQQQRVMMAFAGPLEPVMLKGDYGLLRQAILNIAVNAIEAMDQGGELSFGVERMGEFCLIRIADTGPGMAREQQEKIFRLYFTTKVRGSGIGLAMTFRAIQLHGGTIEGNSEPGKGSEFLVRLPLNEMNVVA